MNNIIEQFIKEEDCKCVDWAKCNCSSTLRAFSSYLQSHGYEIVKREEKKVSNGSANWCSVCGQVVWCEHLEKTYGKPESPKLPEKMTGNLYAHYLCYSDMGRIVKKINEIIDYLHDQRK